MIKQSLTLGFLAVCSAGLAVLTPWYIVTHQGVGVETDAFFAAGALPQLAFVVAVNSLTHVIVPLLATKDEQTFNSDSWTLLIAITGLFAVISLILFITANNWVDWLVPGFSADGKILAVKLTRIQLVNVVLIAAVVVLWSIYYARQSFVWIELSPVIANGVSLLFLVWSLPRFGVEAAAWATVLNYSLKLILLLPILEPRPLVNWRSPILGEAWHRIKPFFIGQTYYRSDPLVDRFLTSMTSTGSLSLLYLGQQIYAVANNVLNKAISSPMVPSLAINAKAENWVNFRNNYRTRLLWTGALTGLACLILIFVGEPLVHILIGHGGMTRETVASLWWTMVALSGVLVGTAMTQVTSASFYAMGDTRTPVRLFVYTFTAYIPLKILIFRSFGLFGLATTISLYFVVNAALQLFVLESKVAKHTERSAKVERDHQTHNIPETVELLMDKVS